MGCIHPLALGHLESSGLHQPFYNMVRGGKGERQAEAGLRFLEKGLNSVGKIVPGWSTSLFTYLPIHMATLKEVGKSVGVSLEVVCPPVVACGCLRSCPEPT